MTIQLNETYLDELTEDYHSLTPTILRGEMEALAESLSFQFGTRGHLRPYAKVRVLLAGVEYEFEIVDARLDLE